MAIGSVAVPRPTLLLFDIDGTLVDSNDYHVWAWQHAFREHGYEIAPARIHDQIGKGGDELMPVFLPPERVGPASRGPQERSPST